MIPLRAKMWLRFKHILLFFLFSSILCFSNATEEVENEVSRKMRAAPHKNAGSNVIDGTAIENSFNFVDTSNGLGERKSGSGKVSVSTVALFTLAMAAASGLGAVPFFFVELDPQWAGLCNGIAAGVMLAASFDLIEEGQQGHDTGIWVVIGILAGGIFVLLCKKVMSLVFHFTSIYLVPLAFKIQHLPLGILIYVALCCVYIFVSCFLSRFITNIC